YEEPRPHQKYVMQWTLNVQRELAPSLTAMIGYAGSRGVHQAFRTDDSRIIIPTTTSAGYLWPVVSDGGAPSADTSKLNNTHPNGGDIRLLEWAGSSSYDARQIGVKKQMSHGWQIQGSYSR